MHCTAAIDARVWWETSFPFLVACVVVLPERKTPLRVLHPHLGAFFSLFIFANNRCSDVGVAALRTTCNQLKEVIGTFRSFCFDSVGYGNLLESYATFTRLPAIDWPTTTTTTPYNVFDKCEGVSYNTDRKGSEKCRKCISLRMQFSAFAAGQLCSY